MAKLNNIILPPAFNAELMRLIEDDIPDEMLILWAKNFLPGGFTKPKVIRDRIRINLESNAPVEPHLLEALTADLPEFALFDLFSIPAFAEVALYFSGIIGRTRFITLLMLHPDPNYHDLANRLMETPNEVEPPDRRVMETEFVSWIEESLLLPLDIDLMEVFEDLIPKPAPFSEEQVKLFESTQSFLFKKLQEEFDTLLKESERQKSKISEYQQKRDEERKRFAAEIEVLNKKVHEATQQRDQIQKQLKEASAKQEQTAQSLAREQTSALVRKWLVEPANSEKLLSEVTVASENLLQKAEAVLQAQIKQDRFSGNRIELEKRLGQLKEARERLRQACSSSLAPLRELREVEAEITAEITTIEFKLKKTTAVVDPLTQRLLDRVNQLAEAKEVQDFMPALDIFIGQKLIVGVDREQIYHALHRKLSLFQDKGELPDHIAAIDPGWLLRRSLIKKQPLMLLVDGHNVLFGLSLFQPFLENGYPGKKAREHLLQMLKRIVEQRPQISARVVFDGPVQSTETYCPNVTIEYSGGEGKHRADHVIEGYAKFKQLQKLDQKMFVVTDDRDLRHAALAHGAKAVPIEAFAVVLTDLLSSFPAP